MKDGKLRTLKDLDAKLKDKGTKKEEVELVDEKFAYGSTPGKATDKSVSSAVDKAIANKGTAASTASEGGKTGVVSGSVSYSGRIKTGSDSKKSKRKFDKPDKPKKKPTGPGKPKPTNNKLPIINQNLCLPELIIDRIKTYRRNLDEKFSLN